MSTLFDFALSQAYDVESKVLAETILLMTNYEIFQNNMFYPGKNFAMICWERLIRDALVALISNELEQSKVENRSASLSTVLSQVKGTDDELEQVLVNLPIWNQATEEMKQWARNELELRLGDVCAMPDLERKNEHGHP